MAEDPRVRSPAGLGRAPPVQEPPPPATPIRRSVQQDYVVCLECGFRAQTLRRHLRVAHGLDVPDYRARWQLPMNYPVTRQAIWRGAQSWPRRSVSGANRVPLWRARRPPLVVAGGVPGPKDSAPARRVKLIE
jgi:ROS/MUCR transcriptional regulator protein